MKMLKLYANEYLWSKDGTHICCPNGFAMRAEADCEVEIEDEHFERVFDLVMQERNSNPVPAMEWTPVEEAPMQEEVSEPAAEEMPV